MPAQHWSARGPFDDERARSGRGGSSSAPSAAFYFAGDTGYFAGFVEIGSRLGPFDLAALPIGAYEPPAMMQPVHLNPEEAVRAAARRRRRAHRSASTTARSTSPTSRSTSRRGASTPPLAAAGIAEERGRPLRIGETRGF